MMLRKSGNIISLITLGCFVLLVLASTSLATFHFPYGSQVEYLEAYSPSIQEGHAWNFALNFYNALGDHVTTFRSQPFRPLKTKFRVIQLIKGENPKILSQPDAIIRFRAGMEGLDEKLLTGRFFQSLPEGLLELKMKGEATNEHLQDQSKTRYVNHEGLFKFSRINGMVKLEEVTMILGVERRLRVTEDLFKILQERIIITS